VILVMGWDMMGEFVQQVTIGVSLLYVMTDGVALFSSSGWRGSCAY
jgi:hypothetical protein